MEELFEIVFMTLFSYPGAAIRWLFSKIWGSKKTLKEYTDDDVYMNGTIGIIVITLVVLGLVKLLS